MNPAAQWHEVLKEHNPRPNGDPFDHPWWVKGEYARVNQTKWTSPDGTRIEGGRVVSLGDMSQPRPEPQERPAEVSRSVQKAPAGTKVAWTPKKRPEPDVHARRVAACQTIAELRELFVFYGVDQSLLNQSAPNAGVRKMRILNAFRRAPEPLGTFQGI
jgi:hypothetical protein